MDRCTLCNGRILKTETGTRCMNPQCENAKGIAANKDTVQCHCGENMVYRGLNSWGEPEYVCTACGAMSKL